ncbi:hypothetical protein DRO97_03630 [Archaeoglobales archaeon]|nr:MAG: hypothetical protein DRO97_03630 [Archaeoglobales archaeon]
MKEIVSEELICPACGKPTGHVLKSKFGVWFTFECQACKTKFKALTLPDSNYWVIFPSEKEK